MGKPKPESEPSNTLDFQSMNKIGFWAIDMGSRSKKGGFYAWRIPFESGYNETEALERDFNSGPPATVLHYRLKTLNKNSSSSRPSEVVSETYSGESHWQ